MVLTAARPHRRLPYGHATSSCVSGVLAAAFGLAAGAATLAAQPATPRSSPAPRRWVVARTPEGHPDFQGVWANNTVTPLQRPKQWEGKTGSPTRRSPTPEGRGANRRERRRRAVRRRADPRRPERVTKPTRTIPAPATTTSSGSSSATGTIAERRSSPIRLTASSADDARGAEAARGGGRAPQGARLRRPEVFPLGERCVNFTARGCRPATTVTSRSFRRPTT